MSCVGSVSSDSSSVLQGRKDLTLSSNAAFTQSSTQQDVVSTSDSLLDLLTYLQWLVAVGLATARSWVQLPVGSLSSGYYCMGPKLLTDFDEFLERLAVTRGETDPFLELIQVILWIRNR